MQGIFELKRFQQKVWEVLVISVTLKVWSIFKLAFLPNESQPCKKKLRLFYCNWIQKHFVLCKAKAYWKLWIHLVWHAALCVPLKSHTRNISVKLSIHLILQKTFSALLLNNMLIFSWWDWKNILVNIVVHVIWNFQTHNGWNAQTVSYI